MTLGLATTTIPFRLRGVEGEVSVGYGVNEDPVRWGYDVLDLDWFTPELVRGFPVIQASVNHPAEGYAAEMGWLQIVRYDVRDVGEEERQTIFDVPPQLSETESPYASFGVRPTFFAFVAVRQILSSRQEKRRQVSVDARSTTYVSSDGERIPIVGVRVTNGNPKYPIRVHAVAFTDPSAPEAKLWVSHDTTIATYDAEIIDIPVDRFDETRELFDEKFTAWVELKTGDIFRSDLHPAPAD